MTHFCFVVFSIIGLGPTIGGLIGSFGALILIILIIGGFYCCYRFLINKKKQSKSNNLHTFVKYLKTMILFCRHTYIDRWSHWWCHWCIDTNHHYRCCIVVLLQKEGQAE